MRYKGTFNYYGQNLVLWTYAKDEHKAFNNFIAQLVPLLKYIRIKLYNHFKSQDQDNYLIEEKEEKCKERTVPKN